MKSIRFTGHYDLKDCADDPIQYIGSIQSFGALLVMRSSDFSPLFVSENCEDFLGILPSVLLKQSSDEIMRMFPGVSQVLANQKRGGGISYFPFSSCKGEFRLSVAPRNNTVFIEVLPRDTEDISQANFGDVLYQITKAANRQQNLDAYCVAFSSLLKELIGYDRVMIYRFDPDFNGKVIGESVIPGKMPYLGLHYPHTDIPEQARELYKKVHLRMIVDVQQSQSPLITHNSFAEHTDLDIGSSVLRSSSPIHLQYLQNMGVRSTLTISIMIDQRLWGLVSCHHYTPRYASTSVRDAALALTNVLSTQLHHWERSMDFSAVQEKEHIYQALLSEAINKKDVFTGSMNVSYILGLTNATGAALLRNGQVHTFGKVLSQDTIRTIHSWMKSNFERVFQSSEFETYYPEASNFRDVASGILYYFLDDESDSAIFWFREQMAEGEKWGGNPNFDKKEDGFLSPRNSFEAWQQEVLGKSTPWKSFEIQAGLRFGSYVERELFIRNLDLQKERYKKLTDQLQQANDELKQFNWISSHDMKEPLRKIRLFVDQIRCDGNDLGGASIYFEKIDAAALRMQKLIDDLLSYAGLAAPSTLKNVQLNDLLMEVCSDLGGDSHQVIIGELPSIRGVEFQLRQLFSNLFSNSIKFMDPSRPLLITIDRCELSEEDARFIYPRAKDDFVKISFADNGIGFESDYNEQIFELFQRLHRQEIYPGTGIGLSICKKITETHQGYIKAFGHLGQGTTFHVLLKI